MANSKTHGTAVVLKYYFMAVLFNSKKIIILYVLLCLPFLYSCFPDNPELALFPAQRRTTAASLCRYACAPPNKVVAFFRSAPLDELPVSGCLPLMKFMTAKRI